MGRNRMMCTVSTKCHRTPPGRRTSTTLSPTTAPTPACFWRNKSDCRRVLTTSNGLVTMAPHIPPRLYGIGVMRNIVWSELCVCVPPSHKVLP